MSDDHRQFVDYLRESLGLQPLYRQKAPEPPFLEQELGTCYHPALLVAARTPTQHEVRFTIKDHFSRLSDGRRVGVVFRDGANRPSWRRRLEREARQR